MILVCCGAVRARPKRPDPPGIVYREATGSRIDFFFGSGAGGGGNGCSGTALVSAFSAGLSSQGLMCLSIKSRKLSGTWT